MIYVLSDIHGQNNAFLKMLKLINFKDSDVLYILGDIIDRGNDNLEIIRYVMNQKNIKMILGNHEAMMLDYFDAMNKKPFTHSAFNACNLWFSNGGEKTLNQLKNIDEKELKNILSFIRKLPLYEIVEMNNIKYILSHSRILFQDDLDFDKNIVDNIRSQNIIWSRYFRPDYIPEGYINIHGHTPVQSFPDTEDEVYYYNNNRCIDIDCGCAGLRQLGCIRLDDMKEFYVECE